MLQIDNDLTKTFSLQIKLNSWLTGTFNHRECTEAFKIVFFYKTQVTSHNIYLNKIL